MHLPLGDLSAPRAPLRLRDVPGDPGRRRRLNIGDLTALREDLLAGQARAAVPALRRRAEEPVIRVIDQLHRGTRLARLPFREAACPSPAATGPAAASSYTGCPTTGASTTGMSPSPPGAQGPRPAPRAGRSWRQPLRPVRSAPAPGPVSFAITRYASASRSPGSARGRKASSSAADSPDSSGTAPPATPASGIQREWRVRPLLTAAWL